MPEPAEPIRPPERAGPRLFVAQRQEPLPEERRPLPDRLREGAGDLAFHTRRFFEESLDDLRRRDRFFRLKAGVLAAWIALSLVAFAIATGGTTDPAGNGLGAYVALTRTAMGWGLLVDNRSDEAWTSVRVILNDEWIHERMAIGPNEKVVLGPGQFHRKGEAAPLELEIESVHVAADEGSASPAVVR